MEFSTYYRVGDPIGNILQAAETPPELSKQHVILHRRGSAIGNSYIENLMKYEEGCTVILTPCGCLEWYWPKCRDGKSIFSSLHQYLVLVMFLNRNDQGQSGQSRQSGKSSLRSIYL
jgi:hypothetical protein